MLPVYVEHYTKVSPLSMLTLDILAILRLLDNYFTNRPIAKLVPRLHIYPKGHRHIVGYIDRHLIR